MGLSNNTQGVFEAEKVQKRWNCGLCGEKDSRMAKIFMLNF